MTEQATTSPLEEEVCRRLVDMIRAGRWTGQELLDTLPQLADTLGADRAIVRRAVDRLLRDQVLVRARWERLRLGHLVEDQLRRTRLADRMAGTELQRPDALARSLRLSPWGVRHALVELEEVGELTPATPNEDRRMVRTRGALSGHAWIGRHVNGWLAHPGGSQLAGRYFLVALDIRGRIAVTRAPTVSRPLETWAVFSRDDNATERVRAGHVHTVLSAAAEGAAALHEGPDLRVAVNLARPLPGPLVPPAPQIYVRGRGARQTRRFVHWERHDGGGGWLLTQSDTVTEIEELVLSRGG